MFEESVLKKLVELGKLTEADLATIISRAQIEHVSIQKLLTEEKAIPLSLFIELLSQEFDAKFFAQISDQMVDPALLVRMPFKFLRKNSVIPVVFGDQVLVLTEDPRDVAILDDFQSILKKNIGHGVAPKNVIQDAINKYYPFNTGQESLDELKDESEGESFDLEAEVQDITEIANDAPIVKLVNHIIFQAVKEEASDIHIEPFEKEIIIRFRVDGVMQVKTQVPPRRYHEAIVSRIKIMASLNIAEKRMPQGGRIVIKVADKAIDLRISVLPCNFGERVVMRILDKSKSVPDLDGFGFSERDHNALIKTIEKPNGIILVSGPTGSGKTSTLYSILRRLNRPESNIITVEDPVEYTMSGIGQVQVNEKANLTFAGALREILRQDPDIILIGEIRDAITAQIATQAALTGHLVLSTIHTNNAPATVTRLADMGIEPYLIASSLICVVAQRLVRQLCKDCKKEFKPDSAFLSSFGLKIGKDAKFFKPVGCGECSGSGYKGRLAIFEIMEVTEEISAMIVKNTPASEIKTVAVKNGMTTLAEDGLRRVQMGLTTVEEVMSVAAYAQAG